MAFSADSRVVAVPNQDQVLLLDTQTNRVHKKLDVTGWKQGLAFSPDGRWLAAGGEDDPNKCPLEIFDARTCELRMSSDLPEGVKRCNFSPDGRFFASVGSDFRIRLRETDHFTIVREFSACRDWLLSVEFSPDGQRIVTGGMDGKVRVWDTESGEELLTLPLRYQHCCWSARWSPAGDAIVVADRDSAVVFRADQISELKFLSVTELGQFRCH
jgi:WD40 repeat protein